MKSIIAQMNNHRFDEDPNSCKIVILSNNEYALIEPDGTLFEYKGETAFDRIERKADGSTEIKIIVKEKK
jgi:hypothetical protein